MVILELPADIVQIYSPKKNQMLFSQNAKEIIKKYDWVPCDSSTLQDVKYFLANKIGMTEVYLEAVRQDTLQIFQTFVPEKLKYECSYTFPDIHTRDKWALPEEKEMYALDIKYYAEFVNAAQKKITDKSVDVKLWRDRLEREHERQKITAHHLIHLYSADDLFFGAVDMQGMVPKIVRYSLFHLLGKAPIPEETYSEWYMYLQFLIDIGYVKEV